MHISHPESKMWDLSKVKFDVLSHTFSEHFMAGEFLFGSFMAFIMTYYVFVLRVMALTAFFAGGMMQIAFFGDNC